jgi:hypothetical protein
MKMNISPDHAEAAAAAGEDGSGWWPLDCLRSLGRAASIAAGVGAQGQDEFRGYLIVVAGRNGAYRARVTHYLGKAIRLPAPLRNQLDARFPSPEEAVQHARFLIASGVLNPLAQR